MRRFFASAIGQRAYLSSVESFALGVKADFRVETVATLRIVFAPLSFAYADVLFIIPALAGFFALLRLSPTRCMVSTTTLLPFGFCRDFSNTLWLSIVFDGAFRRTAHCRSPVPRVLPAPRMNVTTVVTAYSLPLLNCYHWGVCGHTCDTHRALWRAYAAHQWLAYCIAHNQTNSVVVYALSACGLAARGKFTIEGLQTTIALRAALYHSVFVVSTSVRCAVASVSFVRFRHRFQQVSLISLVYLYALSSAYLDSVLG